MDILKSGLKEDPVRRWNLPDRIFFGHGACHLLAGAYLKRFPHREFWAEWIRPFDAREGNHIYVTNGTLAFDYHGSSCKVSLLAHHRKGWTTRFPDWDAAVERVDFDLLDTTALNARNMRGPDQYLNDPIARAIAFLERYAADENDPGGRERSQTPASGTKPRTQNEEELLRNTGLWPLGRRREALTDRQNSLPKS